MITILEISKQIFLSKYKTKYWLELLSIEPVKKDRKLFFSADCVKLLEVMKNLVASNIAPAAAASEIKATYSTPEVSKEIDLPRKNYKDRFDNLEKAVMLLVESNTRLSEDNKLLRTQNNSILETVAKQSKNISNLSLLIAKPAKFQAVKVWQPPIKQVAQVPFMKRLWLEIFNPEALRAVP